MATIPDQLYREGCVTDARHGMEVAEEIGYVLLRNLWFAAESQIDNSLISVVHTYTLTVRAS